jgi:hypothetical protein
MLTRWITLLIIVINISFNYILDLIDTTAKPINVVSAKYNSLFVPAGYAFSIWGIIYLASLAYGIVQLLPRQRNNMVYNRLNPVFILLNTAGMLWISVFRHELITLSVLFIVLMLVCAMVLFVRSHNSIIHSTSYWLTVPLSLYMGWLSVATLSNIAAWLVSLRFEVESISPTTWVLILVAVTTILTIIISIRYADAVFPLVIAWAIWALRIELQNKQANNTAVLAALVVTLLSVVACIWAIAVRIKRAEQQKNALAYRP